MRRVFRIISRVLLSIGLIWGLLTIWVEQLRPAQTWEFPVQTPKGNILVLFNPDPIYNLDQQVAESFATAAQQQGWHSSIVTLAAADTIDPGRFDLFVFCANTYNWSPDRPTKKYIRKARWLEGRPVVAIIMGSGSTARSGRLLRELLQEQGAVIVQTTDLWLMRPNDESQTNRGNVSIARSKAEILARRSLSSLKLLPELPER